MPKVYYSRLKVWKHESCPEPTAWLTLVPQADLLCSLWCLAYRFLLWQPRRYLSIAEGFQQHLYPSWLPSLGNSAAAQGSVYARSTLWPCCRSRCWGRPWPAPYRTGHASWPMFSSSCFLPWECVHLCPWLLSIRMNTKISVDCNSDWKMYLLLMLAELPNAAAISGSRSIMRSRFSAS